MNAIFDDVDPTWAWQPYEPGTDGAWDLARAAHLFRRAGLGANAGELDEVMADAPAEAVAQLAKGGSCTAGFDIGADRLAATVASAGGSARTRAKGRITRPRGRCSSPVAV